MVLTVLRKTFQKHMCLVISMLTFFLHFLYLYVWAMLLGLPAEIIIHRGSTIIHGSLALRGVEISNTRLPKVFKPAHIFWSVNLPRW